MLSTARACCLKQTQSIGFRLAGIVCRQALLHDPVLDRYTEEKFKSRLCVRRVLSAAPQDLARRRVPALRSPGAMAAYLDSVLDFVSVELLGCALPRQKRVEPAVINPG